MSSILLYSHDLKPNGFDARFGKKKALTGVDASILDRIKQLAKTISAEKVENVIDTGEAGEMCSECNCEMSQGDMGYVCSSCGKNGGELETCQQTIQITLQNNHTIQSAHGTDTKFRSADDRFNQTYNSAFLRLQKQHAKKNSEFYIPLDILRETAHIYATICHNSPTKTVEMPVDGVVKKDKQRHNLILSSLLQNQLDKNGLSKTDNYICQFNGITKAKLTKSKNRLQTFIKSGAVAHVHPYDRIPSFVYLFLSKLGMDTVHTDIVVSIIRRADEQVDMIKYRTCQDNSKVVGAIWLVARQLNVKLQHQSISEKCERISKSTYMRYVEFIDINRRRINPILVKHKVRPIPRSFAMHRERRDAASRTLTALPEKYTKTFIFTPEPECVEKQEKKRAPKKSKKQSLIEPVVESAAELISASS